MEKRIDSKNSSFFNKKNYLIISLTLIITIVIIALTFIYFLNIEWKNLFSDLKKGFSYGWAYMWMFLILSFVVSQWIIKVVTITYRMRLQNIKVKFSEKVLYALTLMFLTAVTPMNIVTEPYTIFWIKTHGYSTSKATALSTNNSFLWEIAQIIITIPAYVWTCTKAQLLINNSKGLTIFILINVGMMMDVFSIPFFIAAGFWKRLQYIIARIFNRIKQFLHLSYHTKQQTYKTYVVEAKMQREFKEFFFDWKGTIICGLLILFNESFWYLTVFFAMSFILPIDEVTNINLLHQWLIVNVATTANKFMPLPGGEGTIEVMISTLTSQLGDTKERNLFHTYDNGECGSFVDNSIIIWRMFTNYVPAIIGLGTFIYLIVHYSKKIKHKEKIFNN